MSKDRLVLDEDRNGLWFISWCFPESRAAFGAAVPYLRNHDGYRWETRGDAQRALRAAKAALLDARSKVPLPDWAKQALAAGWKMPKGWKP